MPIMKNNRENRRSTGHYPRVRLLLMTAVLLAVVLAGAGVRAQGSGPRLVDRIVAIVDEEAILQSDLDREVELYKMEKEYSGEPITASTAEVRREMLDRLIESKLIIAAAKQADMSVDEEAVEESVQLKIDQFVEHFGSLENLRRELNRAIRRRGRGCSRSNESRLRRWPHC